MKDHNDDEEVREIDCLEAIGHLYAFLDGEIDDAQQLKEIERHIDHCQSCFSRAQMEKALNERLQNFAKDDTPESLKQRMRGLLKDL